ncbi:MAG: hypothetical protein CMH83_18515 [Nocardioides sp.]|nr:hypothetical protein [Nocardioides sp.]
MVQEFRRLGWSPSGLVVQPPGGETLVNFETNFFTGNDRTQQRVVTLLGYRVVIEAEPVEYRWVFGDGETATTSSPGAAYPGLDVTHSYGAAERFAPRVDTVYRGRYRVDGGAWQTITEPLTVPGEAVGLTAIEADPVLVSQTGYR